MPALVAGFLMGGKSVFNNGRFAYLFLTTRLLLKYKNGNLQLFKTNKSIIEC